MLCALAAGVVGAADLLRFGVSWTQWDLASPPSTQDKEKVLADVRSIISQQLGTDLDKASVTAQTCGWG